MGIFFLFTLLKNEDDLKNEDNLRNEDNLKKEDYLILKTVPGPSLHSLSCACFFLNRP